MWSLHGTICFIETNQVHSDTDWGVSTDLWPFLPLLRPPSSVLISQSEVGAGPVWQWRAGCGEDRSDRSLAYAWLLTAPCPWYTKSLYWFWNFFRGKLSLKYYIWVNFSMWCVHNWTHLEHPYLDVSHIIPWFDDARTKCPLLRGVLRLEGPFSEVLPCSVWHHPVVSRCTDEGSVCVCWSGGSPVQSEPGRTALQVRRWIWADDHFKHTPGIRWASVQMAYHCLSTITNTFTSFKNFKRILLRVTCLLRAVLTVQLRETCFLAKV